MQQDSLHQSPSTRTQYYLILRNELHAHSHYSQDTNVALLAVYKWKLLQHGSVIKFIVIAASTAGQIPHHSQHSRCHKLHRKEVTVRSISHSLMASYKVSWPVQANSGRCRVLCRHGPTCKNTDIAWGNLQRDWCEGEHERMSTIPGAQNREAYFAYADP